LAEERIAPLWVRHLRRFMRNRLAVAAVGVLVIIHGVVVLAPYVTPYEPNRVDPANAFAPPGPDHLLGTDEFGRDLYTRLVYGGRVSLTVGIAAMVIAVTVGTLLGALSGYFGGFVDTVIMRFTDALMAIPPFFLLLTILAFFGGTAASIVVVIGLTSWMAVARVVRSEFIRWREALFIEAAHALGASPGRIILRGILPQAFSSIIVSATLGIAFAILIESAVSFLGLGIQPPTPSWGNMLMNAQQYMWTAPKLAVYPGLIILVTVLCYNFVGDGLRDAIDPYLKE